MDLHLLRTFQWQVLLQCHFLMLAANDVDAALRQQSGPGSTNVMDVVRRTFYALQNLLNAAANISKALWGAGGKFAEVRKPLRDSIDVNDDLPLRNVTMRNNFEHFDERLDRWWKDLRNHGVVDLIVGTNMLWRHDEIDRFRLFDPATGQLSFWGQEFNVQALVAEVRRILPKLEEEAYKPHWDLQRSTSGNGQWRM